MIGHLVAGTFVTAGLLLPGVGWAYAFRWPAPWLAGGVISSLAIFAGVVGFSVIGVPVTIWSVTPWLIVVALGGAWTWRRRRPAAQAAEPPDAEWWLALPALPMLLIVVVRAGLQPLSGADTDFRWDHLAKLIVETGQLDYYPPFTAEGFSLYFWADGIAPLVSGLYAWTYLAAGSPESIWTAIPVILQVAGLLLLLHGLGRLWGGPRGGWFAIALCGATMLLQFAFGLGQETGLTALGAGGMVLYLMHWQRDGSAHLLVPAAACAAMAACAREYGWAFLLVGVGWVWFSRARWESKVGFTVGAALLPAGWHVRNWLLTGNPLYAQDVAGLFPLNPVFHAWMQGYVEIYGKTLWQVAGWREVGRLLLMSAVPALGGFCAGIVLWRRQSRAIYWIALGGISVAVWLASVPFTAGGIFYSMRVMSPLLVLGCAWGGSALARWVPGHRHLAGLLLGLGMLGLDAALRAWTIPINPYTLSPAEWPDAGYRIQLDFARDDQVFMDTLADYVPGKVLSDSAGLQQIFRKHGKKLVPLWSPEVRFLFAAGNRDDAVTRLRELGYTHFLMKQAQFSLDFLTRTWALHRFDGRIHVAMRNQSYVLFALDPAPASGRLSPP